MSAPAEKLARRFHDLYEQLAPGFGYETREETRCFIAESPNGKLMIAVCEALAQSPEVQALIREAVAAERERCAGIADGFGLTWEAVCMAGNNGGVCDDGCDGCIGVATYCSADQIAAAIRTPDAPASADAGRAG